MRQWLARTRHRVRELLRRLALEHTTPARLGLAVGIGVMVGTTPFYGAHMWIAMGLATLLRLNKVAAVLGSSYSVPPLFPVLAFSSVQAGHWLLHGSWLPVSLAGFTELDPATFGSAWVVGSLVVGAGLGATVGTVLGVVAALRARRSAPQALADARNAGDGPADGG